MFPFPLVICLSFSVFYHHVFIFADCPGRCFQFLARGFLTTHSCIVFFFEPNPPLFFNSDSSAPVCDKNFFSAPLLATRGDRFIRSN